MCYDGQNSYFGHVSMPIVLRLFSFNMDRQLRCLVWLLIAWQLIYVVPGTFLPLMASRLSDFECSCPSEGPTEESESETEPAKHGEFCAARRCSGHRRASSDVVQAAPISKQCSRFWQRSYIDFSRQNGFRACRLC
jgi:hypothetical protein